MHLITEALELAKLLVPTWPEISARIRASGVPTCEVATAPQSQLKDKLKEIRSELAKQQDALAEASKEVTAAQEAFAGAGLSKDSQEFKDAKEAVRKEGEIKDRIAELKELEVTTLELLGERGDTYEARHQRPSGDRTDPRGGWDASALLATDRVEDMLQQYAFGASRLGRQEIGEVISRDALAADVTGTTSMRRGEYGGIVSQLRPQLSVLDLIPTGTMDGNTFPYTRESGSFDGAAETAEGAGKPEGEVVFTDDEATARTVAAWLKLQKQSLADVPALRSIIESRLRYLVFRRLEKQVLAGNGSAPNLRGILNTSGIGSVEYADQLITDQILDGLTSVLMADAQATGIVLHPMKWSAALKAKADGDGHYYSGGPFSVTPQSLWGVPLVPSVAVPAAKALVGDWHIGAMLLVREGVRVLLSDSDQDDFTKNKVTLLGEGRFALPVFRPAAFCEVEIEPEPED